MGKEKDKEIEEARYFLSDCWSICLSGCALCLITSFCPVLSLNSISDYFSE